MKRPYVIMLSEVTVDGKVTLKRGVSSKIIMGLMDEEANVFLHEERAKSDAIMVGCNTVKIDNPMLTVRYIEGKSPVRVVPCSKVDLSLDSNVLDKEAPTIIATTTSAPQDNIERIKEKGAKVLVVGDKKVDLKMLLNELYGMGIRRLIIEGGPTIAWNMLKDKLIDEIKSIHMPFIVGGSDTPSLIGGDGVGELDKAIRTELIDYFMRGKHLITEYKVLYD